MKNGFTLVELLAVMIILSIIALIAIPAILGIIDESNNKLNLKNVQLYINAVEKEVLEQNLNETFKPDVCSINSNGDLVCNNNVLKINAKGKKPTNGKIVFSLREVNYAILEYEDKEYYFTPSGNVIEGKICELIDGEPNEIGSKYQCKVKDDMEEGFEEGYYFYVLSHNEDGTTNLIMDRNICSDGTFATEDNACFVSWHAEEDDSSSGPVSAMSYLNDATSSWNNIQNLNITYDDEGKNFTGFKITGKARLPYLREVRDVGCVEDSDGSDIGDLSCPVWMVDYLHDVGPDYDTTYQENPIDGIGGYWTLSTVWEAASCPWNVSCRGYANGTGDAFVGDVGVRPVITLGI